jgi:hypothetical protein
MGRTHPNLVGHWRFENNLLDTSGNGNNLTLTAGTQAFAKGRVGNAFSFNGSTTLALSGFVPTINATLCAWVKASASSTVGYVFAVDNPFTSFRQNTAWVGTSNSVRVVSRNTDIDSASFGGTNWTHVAVSFSGRNIVFFKNGVNVGTATMSGDPLLTSGTLRLGGRDGAVFFSGLIDEPQIWNRALQPHHIRAIYNGVDPAFIGAVA